MNEIKIEIRWKQTDKTPIELTKTFFQRNEWAVLKQNDVINGVFSFGCADSKLVDIQINDRNGKEADWAKQLINALKQESDHISSVYLYSNKELQNMQDNDIISAEENTSQGYKYIVPLN